jgi:hypothetical protein
MRALSIVLFLLLQEPDPVALISAGTRVDARLVSSVATATASPGDAIVAIVAEPIRAGSRVVVPQGSRLNGRIETVEPASRSNEGHVRLVFREIELPDGRKVPTWITDAFSASPPNRKLRYPLYMGVGAAAGGAIGGTRARGAGIIGGLLLGFILAGNSTDSNLPDLTLKAGQILHLRFGEDLKLEQRN